MLKIIQKNLIKRDNASGTQNLLIGVTLLTFFLALMSIEMMYDENVKLSNYTEDAITTSLLGAALINIQEYGTSNNKIINEKIISSESGIKYSDLAYLELSGLEKYHTTYGFHNRNQLVENNTLKDIRDDVIEDRYNLYKELIQDNLMLDDNFIPIEGNAYIRKSFRDTTNAEIPNQVSIDCFKIYNCYEFVVLADDYSNLTGQKPLVAIDGTVHNTLNSDGTPIYETWYSQGKGTSFEEAGLIHRYIVEFSKNSDDTFNVERTALNETVYVTNSSGKEIKDANGDRLEVSSTTLYSEIGFLINLGSNPFDSNKGITYKKVTQSKSITVDLATY